jgi:hypothetical protein
MGTSASLPDRPSERKLLAFARDRCTKASGAALAESDHIDPIPKAPIQRIESRNLLGDRLTRLDRHVDVAVRTHVATSGTSKQISLLNITHSGETICDAPFHVGTSLALLDEDLREKWREHVLWVQAVVRSPWAAADDQQALVLEGAEDFSGGRL